MGRPYGRLCLVSFVHTFNSFLECLRWVRTAFVVMGVAKGAPGVPVTPLSQALFNQTTYNRWRKCHDDILAIVTIWWVLSLSHSVTPPPTLKNPGYAPAAWLHVLFRLLPGQRTWCWSGCFWEVQESQSRAPCHSSTISQPPYLLMNKQWLLMQSVPLQ